MWGADCRKYGRALVGERVGISASFWVPELLPSITGYKLLMRAVESMDAEDASRKTQSQISFPFCMLPTQGMPMCSKCSSGREYSSTCTRVVVQFCRLMKEGIKYKKSKNKRGLHPFFLIGRIPFTKLILGQISVLAASPFCPVSRARLGFRMGVYVFVWVSSLWCVTFPFLVAQPVFQYFSTSFLFPPPPTSISTLSLSPTHPSQRLRLVAQKVFRQSLFYSSVNTLSPSIHSFIKVKSPVLPQLFFSVQPSIALTLF